MPDGGADEPPERVAGETDRDERQEQLAEGLVRNGVQRALLVRELPPVPDRELEREDPDDRVDEAAGHESAAGEELERPRVNEVAPGRLRRPERLRVLRVLYLAQLAATACAVGVEAAAASIGTQTETAPGTTLTLNALTFSRSPPSSS